MKILHINSYYGASDFYKNLYESQIKKGLNISVFVPVSSNKLVSNYKFNNYITISKNHNKYDRAFFYIKHNKIYKDLINKFTIKDYSLVHAHSLFSNGFIALKLKKDFKIPYIVAVRNTDINLFFKFMINLRRIGIEILNLSDKIIFLSNTYKETLLKDYIPSNLVEEINKKTLIITNGIDDFWLNNLGFVKKSPKKRSIKLLYVGSIIKGKNIITTLKAIKILINKNYDIKFTVVGQIVNEAIYNKIKDCSFINYIPPKPKEELINIYRNNDIFIMPSIHETFGLVYAEAMSQGLPIIYTKGQGFDKQFLEGEVGYHVNCKDPKDIYKRIKDILKNYESLSENCIKKVNKFNWDKISDQYYNIYLKIYS